MASLTCIIEPDELLGLSALVNLDRAANVGNPGTGTDAEAVSKATVLMRAALAGKLEESRPAMGSVRRSSQEARRRGRRAG